MSKSFLLLTVNGTPRIRPIDEAELASMIEAKQVRQLSRKVYERVTPAPEAAAAPQEYETKVMLPEPAKRRGRPRKAAP